MDIGIGIPNTIPETPGDRLLEWARRAEAAGFSTLASIGAVAYPGHEELTVFAAAGAVTDRIRLLTNILVAPARSGALLAKQAATVDQLTGGRLTLGLSVGWRPSDYELTERSFEDRGERFDRQLEDLRAAWAGKPITEGTRAVSPPPVQEPGVPLLIGGTVGASVRRVVEHGIGWTAGGMPPDAVDGMARQVRTAWTEAGRDGEPWIEALAYFSLAGDQQATRRYLLDYYEPMGAETAEMIAGSVLSSEEEVSGAIEAFEAIGVDELVLDPTVADLDEVERLAEVAL